MFIIPFILPLLKKLLPYLLVIGLIGGGSFFAYLKYEEAISTAYKKGITYEQGLYQSAMAKVSEENKLLTSTASNNIQNLVGIYNQELKDGDAKQSLLLSELNSRSVASVHTLRLYDPYDKTSSCAGKLPANSSTGQNSTRSYEASGTKLSTETSQFLIELTGEADNAARELALCQGTLRDLTGYPDKLQNSNSLK